MFRGKNSLLHTFPAWLRVIGRLKPGATPDAIPSRLTSLLRVWLVDESGMPAEWMTGIKAQLPKQNIKVIPGGTGVGVMKARLRRQPAYPAGSLSAGAADCLREHCEPAAGAGGGTEDTDRRPAGTGREPKAADPAIVDGERCALGARRSCGSRRGAMRA